MVVLLIGLGVFAVLRRGLRPIEAMAVQADRITAGDLAERITPHNPRSEVGRLDEVMGRIVLETRRMGRLVEDMLRLARLGQHPGRCREPVNVTALLRACSERARVADPGRTWRVRVADGMEMTGDEELLRRAVDNLLANVLVHTPPTAAGTLTASAADGAIRVEVSDEVPGVAPDKLPHIFERFYRAGAQPSRPGSGWRHATERYMPERPGLSAGATPPVVRDIRIRGPRGWPDRHG